MDLESVLIGEDNTVPARPLHEPRVRRAGVRPPVVAGLAGGLPGGGDRRGRRLLRVPDRRPVDPGRPVGPRESIRAFHNTCLHRGTRLADGTGRFPEGCIRCRYHAWRYDLDGKLVEVVDRDEFDPIPAGRRAQGGAGRPVGRLRLDLPRSPTRRPCSSTSTRCRRCWPRTTSTGSDLRTYLSTVLPANWKVAVDAFNEGYHVQGTHPQLLPVDRRRQPRVRAARDPRPLRAAAERPAPAATQPAPGTVRGRVRRGRDPRGLHRGPGRPLLPGRERPGRGDPRHRAPTARRC